jgi:hypothetical protein
LKTTSKAESGRWGACHEKWTHDIQRASTVDNAAAAAIRSVSAKTLETIWRSAIFSTHCHQPDSIKAGSPEPSPHKPHYQRHSSAKPGLEYIAP